MQSSHKQSGFSLIEIVITVVVLGLLGTVGYLVYKHHKTTSTSSSGSTSTNSTTSIPASSLSGAVLGIDTPLTNESKAISEIGKTPSIIDGFYQWQDTSNNDVSYPKSWVDSIVALGSMPMITWEPDAGEPSSSKNQPQFNLSSILSGKYDSFIKQWAVAAKEDNHPLYVRLMHEMNDNGYAWAAGVNGNTPSQYVSAFQHIVNLFRESGANNVQFIWCIGANKVTNIQQYYPGDSYVSWLSIDGYNRDKPSQSFASIFGDAYNAITAFSKRPVLIAETASVEDPNDAAAKPSWITTAFLQTIPNQFPRIKAINYFDSSGNGFSYAIDSSPQTLAAIKQVYANSYYQAKAPTTQLTY